MAISHTKTIQQPLVGAQVAWRRQARVPALTVLYHCDSYRVGDRTLLAPLAEGKSVELSRLAPDFEPPGRKVPRPLGDNHLSRTPLRLEPLPEGGVRLLRAGSSTPAAVDGELLEEVLEIGAERLAEGAGGAVLELGHRVVLLLHGFGVDLQPPPPPYGLVGESEGILRVRQEILRVADLEVPVLLRGETGTGKELVAGALHQASRRRGLPCLSLNMGAIPPQLAAAELFGAAKGAYTSSVSSQAGYFQRAHRGTLLLDEIGETPLEIQALLLRALETGEIQRVGGQEPQKVDVRLIAATDADLEEAIRQGTFRAPLLHRLAGYQIRIPPLRQRRDDVARLLFHFLRQELRETGEEYRLEPPPDGAPPWLPPAVVARLVRHPWPGNVRQLRNAARQMVIGSRGSQTLVVGPELEELLREAAATMPAEPGVDTVPPGLRDTPSPDIGTLRNSPRKRRPSRAYRAPSEVPESELLEALRTHRWQLKPVAEQLGISRASLYVLVDRSDKVRKARDLSREEILACRQACDGRLEAMVDRLEVSKSGLQQRMTELGIR